MARRSALRTTIKVVKAIDKANRRAIKERERQERAREREAQKRQRERERLQREREREELKQQKAKEKRQKELLKVAIQKNREEEKVAYEKRCIRRKSLREKIIDLELM